MTNPTDSDTTPDPDRITPGEAFEDAQDHTGDPGTGTAPAADPNRITPGEAFEDAQQLPGDPTGAVATPSGDTDRVTPGEAFEGAIGGPDGAMGGSVEKP